MNTNIWKVICKCCKLKRNFSGTQSGYNKAYRCLAEHEKRTGHAGRLELQEK